MTRHRRPPGVRTLLAVVLLALTAPAFALAYPIDPCKAADFDPSALLVNGGRAVKTSGPLRCWAGGTIHLRATLSERSTRTQAGGIAQGTWTGRCTGTSQHWHLTATTSNDTRLRAGCAQADGLVIYSRNGETIDIKQWQTMVRLTTTTTSTTAC